MYNVVKEHEKDKLRWTGKVKIGVKEGRTQRERYCTRDRQIIVAEYCKYMNYKTVKKKKELYHHYF